MIVHMKNIRRHPVFWEKRILMETLPPVQCLCTINSLWVFFWSTNEVHWLFVTSTHAATKDQKPASTDLTLAAVTWQVLHFFRFPPRDGFEWRIPNKPQFPEKENVSTHAWCSVLWHRGCTAVLRKIKKLLSGSSVRRSDHSHTHEHTHEHMCSSHTYCSLSISIIIPELNELWYKMIWQFLSVNMFTSKLKDQLCSRKISYSWATLWTQRVTSLKLFVSCSARCTRSNSVDPLPASACTLASLSTLDVSW